MSLPKVWNEYTFDALNVDPVFLGAAATTTAYQTSVRDGVEQNANGDWVEKYVARDMFADDPELGTKAEQEAAYQQTLDDQQATAQRRERDTRIVARTHHHFGDVFGVQRIDFLQHRMELATGQFFEGADGFFFTQQ